MEAVSSEMSLNFSYTVWHHIPEESDLHSCIVFCFIMSMVISFLKKMMFGDSFYHCDSDEIGEP
jgi:hypothetical protein